MTVNRFGVYESLVDETPYISAPEYVVLAEDILTQEIKAELPFIELSFGRARNGAGNFSLSLPYYHDVVTYNNVEPLATAIHIFRDGACVSSGVVWEIDAQESRATVEVAGEGLFSLFQEDRRIIREDFTRYSADPVKLACDLVKYAQSTAKHGPAANYHIGVEQSRSTIVVEEMVYLAVDNHCIGTVITDLAESASSAGGGQKGFEFTIVSEYSGVGNVTKTFVAGAPTISQVDEPVLYLFSDSEMIEDSQLRVYGKSTIRRATAVGAGEPDVAPSVTRSATDSAYPLIERVKKFDAVDSMAMLKDSAAAAVRDYGAPRAVPDFRFTANRNDSIIRLTPGDLVYLNISTGFAQTQTAIRSSEISVTYNSDGQEQAEIRFIDQSNTEQE